MLGFKEIFDSFAVSSNEDSTQLMRVTRRGRFESQGRVLNSILSKSMNTTTRLAKKIYEFLKQI